MSSTSKKRIQVGALLTNEQFRKLQENKKLDYHDCGLVWVRFESASQEEVKKLIEQLYEDNHHCVIVGKKYEIEKFLKSISPFAKTVGPMQFEQFEIVNH